ncbi:hypothetical protein [Sinorhizobium meliloti]|uniref:hypothetical protein n=1 Tax=Rhizobium meliloti TaxID=382 RepID=UPI00237F8D89|nr:hypothetical protein [Sinorhizobium meliloti]
MKITVIMKAAIGQALTGWDAFLKAFCLKVNIATAVPEKITWPIGRSGQRPAICMMQMRLKEAWQRIQRDRQPLHKLQIKRSLASFPRSSSGSTARRELRRLFKDKRRLQDDNGNEPPIALSATSTLLEPHLLPECWGTC